MAKISKIETIVLSIVLLGLFLFNNAEASTIVAKSCSYENVKAAYDSAIEGETILVPAGSATWNSTLTITKGIRLVGAGSGCPDACDNATTITNGDIAFLINIAPSDPASNPFIEITGFTFDGNNVDVRGIGVQNLKVNPYSNFRIHHNAFKNFGTGSSEHSGIITEGLTYGLVDHNYFYNNRNDLKILGWDSRSISYSWDQYTKAADNTLLYSSLGMGGANFLYIENNISENILGRFITSGTGARWVYRHNTGVMGDGTGGVFDVHGDKSNSGTVAVEIYENTVTVPDTNYTAFKSAMAFVAYRGGTAIIYNNEGQSKVGGAYIGLREETPVDTRTYVCGTLRNGYDMKVHNSYIWNNINTTNSALMMLYRAGASYDPYNCIENGSDYWADTNEESSNPQSSYAFTKDVAANRNLSSCNEDDIYWETDNKVLYRCTTTNTWTKVYEPYTYPHPLGYVEGALPGNPQKLQAVP